MLNRLLFKTDSVVLKLKGGEGGIIHYQVSRLHCTGMTFVLNLYVGRFSNVTKGLR